MNDRAYHLAYKAMGTSSQEFDVPRAWFEAYSIELVQECIRALQDNPLVPPGTDKILLKHFDIE